MGQWCPRDKRQSVTCGLFPGVEIADESLSLLKMEKILCTFHTAFRLLNVSVTGSQIQRKPKQIFVPLSRLPSSIII